MSIETLIKVISSLTLSRNSNTGQKTKEPRNIGSFYPLKDWLERN